MRALQKDLVQYIKNIRVSAAPHPQLNASNLEILQMGDVGYCRNGVVREVEVLQPHVVAQALDALYTVRCEAEPRQELELSEALHCYHTVVREVEDLEVAELGHLKHSE